MDDKHVIQKSDTKSKEDVLTSPNKNQQYTQEYYLQEAEQVFQEMQTSREGLTLQEATTRLGQSGKNVLEKAKGKSLGRRFLEQLADPMIIILICAAVVSGVLAYLQDDSYADVIIIMIVVIVNAILGVYQESKAEAAIEALQKMSASTSNVLRDGQVKSINSEDIVPGDIVILEAGDSIPADGRLIESATLKIEESSLTGESVPVNKLIDVLNLEEGSAEIPLADRKNMAYMGTTVVYGRGVMCVTNTGMDTEMGKIAGALHNAEENKTPLQIKMAQLSKTLTWLVLGICIVVFVVQMLKAGGLDFKYMLDSFMIAVSLAVAAIPEGLAAVVTVVLSIGVTNMSKRNAIIRKLTAVETLGCAQIVCSDKTGTLTQNKMTVVDSYGDDKKLLADAMALCNDAEFSDGEVVGEPTEAALVTWADSIGENKTEISAIYKRVGEAPFDSGRKMMSTVHENPQTGKFVQFTKGGPDVLVPRCTKILVGTGKDAQVRDITDADKAAIQKANKQMANKALRVLSAAVRYWDEMPESCEPQNLEQDLIFVGLTGMIDPVRPEVKDSIAECESAGIKPVMITGDNIDTAKAIATELGILKPGDRAITGSELNKLSDEEFAQEIHKISAYARVQPEHKTRIVKTWQSEGYVVAMTGDGVNDAPSIKNADIGIGMGITGTDVTKNVADMVLADDNFATIVNAVEEGRRIYDNIRKAIQFLLGSNLAEVLVVFIATLMGFVILKPVHLLWINLITDCFPALALGMEESEPDVMQRKPRKKTDGIFAGGMGIDIAYQGVLVAVVVMISYFVGHYLESGVIEIAESPHGITMAFLTLSMAEIFHSLNMRSQRKLVFTLKKRNWFLIGAAVGALVLTTVVCEVPFLVNAFDFTSVGLVEYLIAIGLGALVFPIVEIVKFFQGLYAKRKQIKKPE